MSKKNEKTVEVMAVDMAAEAPEKTVENVPDTNVGDMEPAVDLNQSVVVTAENGLNLRSRPMADAYITKVLPEGAVVQVLTLPVEVEGWCPVFDGDDLGWVRREYIEAFAEI